MHSKTCLRDDLAVVTLSGSLDATVSGELRLALQQALSRGVRALILDLSAVSFVDSSGLAALVSILKAARTRQAEVALCSLALPVRTVLELTRLDRVFDIYADVDQAQAAQDDRA